MVLSVSHGKCFYTIHYFSFLLCNALHAMIEINTFLELNLIDILLILRQIIKVLIAAQQDFGKTGNKTGSFSDSVNYPISRKTTYVIDDCMSSIM